MEGRLPNGHHPTNHCIALGELQGHNDGTGCLVYAELGLWHEFYLCLLIQLELSHLPYLGLRDNATGSETYQS